MLFSALIVAAFGAACRGSFLSPVAGSISDSMFELLSAECDERTELAVRCRLMPARTLLLH
jgi:hypothetical protein